MKINLTTYGPEPPDKGSTERPRAAPASDQSGNDAVSLDRTRFTFDQTRVRALESQVLAQPEVRQEKVDQLRQAVGKGEYAVSDGQIADAMLADLAAGVSEQVVR